MMLSDSRKHLDPYADPYGDTISPEGNVTYGYHNFDGMLNNLIEDVLKYVPEFDGVSYLLQDQLPQGESDNEDIDDWKGFHGWHS